MNKKVKLIISVISLSFILCYIVAFVIASLMLKRFSVWNLLANQTIGILLVLLLLESIFIGLYYLKHYWLFHSKNIIKGKETDKHFEGNLEEARFQSDEELRQNYQEIEFHDLKEKQIVGTIVKAEEKDGKLDVTFAKASHCLIIGTTGSGKTTSYVNPIIQILANTKTKPSLFVSDPKGELFQSHAKALEERGYEVKVLDLRNPFNSIRWNPLQRAYEYYQRMIHLDEEVIAHTEDILWFEWEEKRYDTQEEIDTAIQVKKQELFDVVYEDIHDIVYVLCPDTKTDEPMWNNGARNLILAIALAMLEDSEKPELGLSKEKYNFYALTKVATTTDNDCVELINYFKKRSPLSKAVSLSRQVLDASDKTRGSYLSSTFDRLSMFSDLSLCALTSENEIEFASMGEKPIALFLQIPDEKETRHTLASMVILQAYKELVAKANSSKNLTLPRPVYFVLDEFGNLPKIHKLEQMITVGRSRNIWMNLVVQSYAQLAKVYEDKSAEIIKSNCNTQVFIGTTDFKTIEEFSKRCGNYTMMQRSVGFNSAKGEDINSNTNIKERPLIYPSELQMLNHGDDMGNAIVTVFGYQPIKSKFTPSYQSSFYEIGNYKQKLKTGRFFDESKAFYDIKKRNSLMLTPINKPGSIHKPRARQTERKHNAMLQKQCMELIKEGLHEIIEVEEVKELLQRLEELNYDLVISRLKTYLPIVIQSGRNKKIKSIEKAIEYVDNLLEENIRK